MKILKLPEVIAKTGLSKSTIYAKAKAGTFAKPLKLGTRASAWIEEEIDAWIAGRITARDEGHAAPAPVAPDGRKAEGKAKPASASNARVQAPKRARAA